ncbi:MAG: enoyl-CoA hydratase/isomerase family protein [Acidobacteriota bacterium]|nr:enoyl-CoA hydratase/isomerase family protein [Acidobacteriota bacterium]MDE3092483.1 enoyl-CoA hydratase/isomerase family protein [Acidobacteriota bacterium]MDE3138481.1 enoyl-CoA hydratase/isomerase family protein [Acidobacteriota bacterium]MDE3146286.1 enoyl-CoA hydratase/isomerase family protein [Acidobacteriota bacterium]
MSTMTRIGRTVSLTRTRIDNRWRRSTRWLRARRHPRLAVPPATTLITHKAQDGVFEIRLSGGARRNVLGRSTIDEIEQLVATPPHGTRVIVITAEPPDFCAGYDLVEASRGTADDLIAHERNFATLRTSVLPIVVALQGNVIGGGLELALSADVRIASPETRFAVPAAKLGLVYSEAGVRLVKEVIGESFARAMFLAGRELSADTALSIGLVTEIVGRDQLRARALEYATNIATWSFTAATGNRQILDAVDGRVAVDTAELRHTSFAPHGDLSQSITDFVKRRAQAPGGLVEK